MNTPASDSWLAAPRPTPSLATAFGGVWRLTFPQFLTRSRVLVSLLLLVFLGVLAYAFLHGSPRVRADEHAYLRWCIGFYFTFLVPILSFLSSAGAIRDDLSGRTLDYVLTRPVQRPAFVAFKFIAHVAGVQIQALLASAVFIGFGALRSPGDMMQAMPHLLLAQALMVFAFSALGFLCGVLTSRYVVLGLVYGLIIEVGVGSIPTQLNRLSMTQHVKAMLEPLADRTAVPSLASLASTGAVLGGFTLGALAIAATIFTLRELASANEV